MCPMRPFLGALTTDCLLPPNETMADPALIHHRGTAPFTTGSCELIVADGRCSQLALLGSGALHPVEWLHSGKPPLQAIGELLDVHRQQGRVVHTLHLLAHGRPGAIQFGDALIDAPALAAASDQLGQWGVSTIALWSCEVGADRGFVTLLAELSGATVWSAEGRLYRHRDGSSQLALRAPAYGQNLALQTAICLRASPFNSTLSLL